MGTMTDEAKALVEWLCDEAGFACEKAEAGNLLDAADLIETQAREIERLNAILSEMNDTDVIARTMAENKRLRGIVRGWHYLAVGPDEMGDYYTQKALIKASEPYASPALKALAGDSHDQ